MRKNYLSTNIKNSTIINIEENHGEIDSVYLDLDKGKRDKTKKKQKQSKLPVLKTEEERRASSKEILKQLEGLDLSITHPPVRELLKLLKQYNETGDRIVVNIPFPELSRRIKGVLASSVREETYIVLKHEKF